ncbi:hypothetical protein WKW50_05500 [Ochrobactrum sp. GPK 3]
MKHASSSLNNASPAPDDLYAGDVGTMPVVVGEGTYVRGEVLGLVGNVYGKLSVEGASAAAVMPFPLVVAAGATTKIAVYTEGDFNEDALVIGDAVLDDVKTSLRKFGITSRKWGAAPTNF